MNDVVLLTKRRIFNIILHQYGSQHFQMLLPDDKTNQVALEVGAVRTFINENDRLPNGEEWRSSIPAYRERVMDQMESLPKLYIEFEDEEIRQPNRVFAYQINPTADDIPTFEELSSMVLNFQNRDYHSKLILLKLIEHHSIPTQEEYIDMGFLPNGNQSCFFALCLENIRLMFNGGFICMACAQSFSAKCDFKAHLKVCYIPLCCILKLIILIRLNTWIRFS